jgi:hypothetical protein
METIGTPLLWAGFAAFLIIALAVDLWAMRNTGPHKVSNREALVWSGVWIGLALVFNAGLWFYLRGQMPEADATRVATEFLTGYLVEKALAVDNIFVFLMLFNYFAVPAASQQRVLVYGVLGAIVLRAILIWSRRGADRPLPLGAVSVRAASCWRPAPRCSGPRARNRPGEQSLAALDHQPPAADARLPRRGAVDRRRRRRCYTPLFVVLVMIGDHRRDLRRRFDPGDLRDHHRSVHRADLERVRGARTCAPCTSCWRAWSSVSIC